MLDRSRAPIRIGEWIADPQTDTITRRGETQKLEPRTMRLLLLLADSPGEVLSVERMLNDVWHGVVVGSASVYQAISQLRRALGDSDASPIYLATVPRKGYRLIAPVSLVTPAVPAKLTPPDITAPRTIPPATIEPAKAPASTAPPRLARPLIVLVGAIALLIMVVVWISRGYLLPPQDAANSIVVLPFVDLTEGSTDQVFCDGLSEELSNWLAQIPTLRVVARTSAIKVRGKNDDIVKIGKDLNVTHALEGSIRRSGDHMRITAKVFNARTGEQTWSDDFDMQVDDTIKTQEMIARAVASNLQIHLTPNTTQKFAQRGSANPQAYNLYILASHYRLERTRESTRRAVDLYQQALMNDPNFALAYVGLAYAYLNQHWVDTRSLEEVTAAAEPQLAAAQQLDPQLSELFAVRGALRAEQGRLSEAQTDLQRAVAVNSNNSWAFSELARLYLMEGRPREALQTYAQSILLDPLDFMNYARKCIALTDMASYTEAEVACERGRQLQDQGNFGTVATAWLERSRGNIPEAQGWILEAQKVAPDDIDLYRQRADLLMTIGLSALARDTYDRALDATHDDEEVNLGRAAIVFYDSGTTALRSYLATHSLGASGSIHNLVRLAYYYMLAGDDAGAQRIITRAKALPNFNAEALNDPWFARWGDSDLLIVAQCELRNGDQSSATQHLHAVETLLDREAAAGTERFGIYLLRAEVMALMGNSDAAMQSLTRAADLKWRREWWAEREPFFSALRGRNDFRALLGQVGNSNRELIASSQVKLAH